MLLKVKAKTIKLKKIRDICPKNYGNLNIFLFKQVIIYQMKYALCQLIFSYSQNCFNFTFHPLYLLSMYFVCVSLILCFLVYRYYLKPIRTMKKYKSDFEKAGYKVKMYPHNPFIFIPMMIFFQDYQKHKDCFYSYKHQLKDYDVIISSIGTLPFIRFHHPELTKQFFSHQRQWCYIKYAKRFKYLDRLFGEGIFRSQRQNWHRKRKILNKVFTYDLILKMGPMMETICDYVLDKYDKGQNTDIVYSSDQMLTQITSNVIVEGFLGSHLRNEKIEDISASQYLVNLTADINIQMMERLSWVLGPQFLDLGVRKKDREINSRILTFQNWIGYSVKKTMKEEEQRLAKNQEKSPNIISALMKENLNLPEGEKPYTEQQIIDEFKTFFNAGTDTTSHLIQAAIYYIVQNPEIEQKLREEIANNCENSRVQVGTIKNMKYLDSVVKETLRVCGPANLNFSRTVVQDHEISGVKIYKDTIVQETSIWSHFSSDYYKEPLAFRPERWLNGQCEQLNPFKYVPFYSGARSCLGKQLSLLESKIALIRFLTRYKKIEILEDKVGFFLKFVFQTQDYHLKLQK